MWFLCNIDSLIRQSFRKPICNFCILDNQHHHERRGKYRLEEEELTHLGQSLGEIDKFDDVLLSDDDDNVDNNQDDGIYDEICLAFLLYYKNNVLISYLLLRTHNDTFFFPKLIVDDVKELHFGGFLTKKKTADNLSDKVKIIS